MAIEDTGEPLPIQPPNQGTTTPGGWFQQNVPPGSYNTGISGYMPGGVQPTGGFQQTQPAPMTGGQYPLPPAVSIQNGQVVNTATGQPYQQGGTSWIDQELQRTESRDDPAYWHRVIAADPKVAAGDQSAIDYWKMRIQRGDTAAIRSGQLQPYGSEGGGGGGTLGGTPLSQMGMDPGYQFRLGEGLKGIERGAAARGTLLTGGLQKGLQRYAQDYASGEFGNIFNRNLALADLGLRGVGGYSGAAQNYGTQAGGLVTGAGNAAAAGTIGSSNAWTGTLGNIGQNAANIAGQYYWNQPQQPVPYSGPIYGPGY